MAASSSTASRARRSSSTVVALCFVIIVFDGYDLVVYGTTVPSLLAYQQWELTPGQVGTIGSYALVGMLLGALLSGWLAPRVGARAIVLTSLVSFSVLMGLTALAPNPEIFGLLRFLGGLGLGGVVPTVIALTVEYSPPARRQFNNALMYSGYSVGGVLAALAAIALLPDASFRVMYAIGLLPLVTIVPLAWRYLPESVAFLVGKGRADEAKALADRFGIATPPEKTPDARGSMASLVTGPRALPLLLLVIASFCGLLLVYGVNTWLPNIMRQAGYSLGSSLSFLLVLNIGAIAGALTASRVADRFGSKPVTVVSFLLAVLAILALGLGLPLYGAMIVVAVAGLGTVGTQILVNGYVATFFGARDRTSALGLSLGLGRVGAIFGPILGGWIASSTLGVEWNFYTFAVFAGIGCIAVSLVNNKRSATDAQDEPRVDHPTSAHQSTTPRVVTEPKEAHS
ncbi:MFS transporter [Rhodococcus sp. 14-2470-1b]|nr:MFS transporter [Rhodococcus sp. 15-1189-1-1a]OZF10150.1 MFS transporter [Rhodococcus sp. 14-2686-1-2]OZF55584.1 MFS transporter [Rhodococcus sp. 14-2470-1b]